MHKNLPFLKRFSLVLASGLFLINSAQAQVSDCSIFLLGQKVEAGVNWNGALGASTAPPSGSHANWSTSLYNSNNCSGTLYTGISLGAIADPDGDGWTTGATPFFGDFVLPGGANEGWSIMFNGVQKNAWNSEAAVSDSIDNMSAYLYSYNDSAGIKTAKTQAHYNGMYITQWVSLDTTKLFLSFQVLIENVDLATATDVYYMRTINPHNDQSVSSNPSTWNRILYQFPDTGSRAVATARGSVYNNAFLAVGAKDNRAKVFVAKHAQLPPITVDYIDAEDTGFLYHTNDSTLTNGAIGIEYNIGTLNSGTAALLNFFYAFSPDAIDDAIYSSHVGITDAQLTRREFSLYPNPIRNTFKVTGLITGDEVQVYDVTGRKMGINNLGNGEYNVENLATGTYVGIVTDKNGLAKGHLRLQKL